MSTEFKDELKSKFIELCGKFYKSCKEKPTTLPKDIPEAVKAMDEIKEFEYFVKKYFNLDLEELRE